MNEWTAFLIKSMESLISSFLPNLDLGEGRTDFIVPGGTNGRRESLCSLQRGRHKMGFGRGALLWLLGVPLDHSSLGTVLAPLAATSSWPVDGRI
jgi:hypothetical protein